MDSGSATIAPQVDRAGMASGQAQIDPQVFGIGLSIITRAALWDAAVETGIAIGIGVAITTGAAIAAAG